MWERGVGALPNRRGSVSVHVCSTYVLRLRSRTVTFTQCTTNNMGGLCVCVVCPSLFCCPVCTVASSSATRTRTSSAARVERARMLEWRARRAAPGSHDRDRDRDRDRDHSLDCCATASAAAMPSSLSSCTVFAIRPLVASLSASPPLIWYPPRPSQTTGKEKMRSSGTRAP